MRKVGLYLRVSTQEQAERGWSIEGQHTELRRFCEGRNHYAYQTDALGSVRMLTGGGQNATDTYAYDAWGNPVSQSGSLANPLTYTGAIYDSSNGFYDLRARFYDPSSGLGGGAHSFLSPDPNGGGYAYAGDSPTNFVDPTGMRTEKSGESGPSMPAFSWSRCAVPIGTFVLQVLLSRLGIELDFFPEAEVARMAQALTSFSGFYVDWQGIQQDPWNPGEWIGLFLDIGLWFFWNILIPVLTWWMALEVTADAALTFTGPGLAVDLLNVGLTTGWGFTVLVTQGCVFP